MMAALRALYQREKLELHHVAVAVAVVLAFLAGTAVAARDAVVFHSTASMAQGPDVSRWQNYLPCSFWSGQAFGLAKAGGADSGEYTDPQYAHNIGCLRQLGINRGSYYFASPPSPDCCGPTSNEGRWGIQQADDYLARLNANGGFQTGEAAMLDLETGSGDQSTFAAAFLDEFYARTGARPLIYASLGYIGSHLTSMGPGFAQYPLDLADWYYGLPPNPPAPWTHLTLWQWTDSGSVNGVYPVDLNYQVTQWPGKPAPAPTGTNPPPPAPSGNCSIGTARWSLNPWPNGDGNQSIKEYHYTGYAVCSSAEFNFGLYYVDKNTGKSTPVAWTAWQSSTDFTWNLSRLTTPCSAGHLTYHFMLEIRSGNSGGAAAYQSIGSFAITSDCA